MTTTEQTKRLGFVVLLLGILIWIYNLPHHNGHQQATRGFTPAPVSQPFTSQPSPARSPAPNDVIHTPSAAEVAAAQLAKDLARYVNSGFSRRPGIKMVAIAAVGEDGTFNDAVGDAIAPKLKSDAVETVSSFFTPEFVSDGLFSQTFSGSRAVVNKLDLAKSLDTLLLARQTVRYSKDASLNNVITATMQLDVKTLPIAMSGRNPSWSFTASGAGFKQEEARAMAQERLIKQIANATNVSLNQ